MRLDGNAIECFDKYEKEKITQLQNEEKSTSFKRLSTCEMLGSPFGSPFTLENSKNKEAFETILQRISYDRNKLNDKIFIMSAAYDDIYRKYNVISLLVLILSSVATLFEAFRLSISDVLKNTEYESSIQIISFTINVTTLTIGTIITVLSSIVRFRNYRETLEQLKDNLTIFIGYRDKYNKKYYQILQLTATDHLTESELKIIDEKIQQYDDCIKSINVIQYMRIKDIIRFNKYKAYFDIELQKINVEKNLQIQNIISKSRTQRQTRQTRPTRQIKSKASDFTIPDNSIEN